MLERLRKVGGWAEDHVVTPLNYVAMWPWRRHLNAENTMLFVAGLTIMRWVVTWTIVWALQWWLIPGWLVGSRTGLQTACQVIPTVIVAVLVLVLGSVLVIAQQMVGAYGNRAPLLLGQNIGLVQLVARPLAVTIAAVLLAGQVPDAGDPPEAVTAAAATLTLMTVGIIRAAAPALPAVFFGYSGQVNFVGNALDGVEDYIRDGAVAMVRWRVAIFEDMLRAGVRRGDSHAISGAVHGLRDSSPHIWRRQAKPPRPGRSSPSHTVANSRVGSARTWPTPSGTAQRTACRASRPRTTWTSSASRSANSPSSS